MDQLQCAKGNRLDPEKYAKDERVIGSEAKEGNIQVYGVSIWFFIQF